MGFSLNQIPRVVNENKNFTIIDFIKFLFLIKSMSYEDVHTWIVALYSSIRNKILDFLIAEKNKVTVGPSDWMSVSATGRWNNASYCWKEDSLKSYLRRQSPPCRYSHFVCSGKTCLICKSGLVWFLLDLVRRIVTLQENS